MKAIISGLQSNPVYRLKKAWSHLSKDKLEIFEELARIFSEENNALAQRELLVREGTARFADTVGENDHHLQKVLQKHSENSRVGYFHTIQLSINKTLFFLIVAGYKLWYHSLPGYLLNRPNHD